MLRKVKFQELGKNLKAKISGLFGKKDSGKKNESKQTVQQAAHLKQQASDSTKGENKIIFPQQRPANEEAKDVLSAIPQDDIYSVKPQETLQIKEDSFPQKENSAARDFISPLYDNSVDEFDLKPLGDDNNKVVKDKKRMGYKKSKPKKGFVFVRFIKDIFNGLFVALCAIACGLLLAESYITTPAPVYAWLAFIPFTLAIFNIRSGLFSFVFGWLTGAIFYFVMLNWISLTVMEGTGDPALATISLVSLCVVLGIQFALFALGSYYAKRMPVFWPITTACFWVGLEVLHQIIAVKFIAFPWFVLGYTQYNFSYLIQISSFTGVYGVSFVVIFTSIIVGFLFTRQGQILKSFYCILCLCVLIVVFSFGYKTVKDQLNYMTYSPKTLRIALMQPYTHKLYVGGRNEDVVYTIAGQLEALKDKKAAFIIWPESSLPGDLDNSEYLDYIKEQSQSLNAWQLFGGNETFEGTWYVGAVLANETGIVDDYKKTKLVPFGEFLPLQSVLGWFYKKHNISSFTGNYEEGVNPGKVLTLNAAQPDNETKEDFSFGTEICFESIFPSIYRKQAANGADFFVNISNDGWFGESAAPYQHLRANVFRAVENRRPLLRSTNTGISAWIDSLGRIRFSTGLNRQESSVFNFTLKERDQKTFYTTYGDLFGYICLLIAITGIIISIVFGEEELEDGD